MSETFEIRQLARQFANSDLRPHVEQWDHDAAIPAETFAQLAELGFFGMLVPDAFGGTEFDWPTYAAALEELAWGEPGVALIVATAGAAANRLAALAGEADRRGPLEAIASGAFTKLVMLTDNRSMFLVPAELAGVSVGGRVTTLGFRTAEIFRGESDANPLPQATAVGHIGIAAIGVGIAQAALEHARGYADVREQFDRKLRDLEGIQFKLAEMAMRTEAARTLLQKAATESRADRAAMAKVFASEAAMWVTTQAVQIFGGYGYMRDYPVEKLMRDAKATELLEAANDLLRVTIARELYK
ncbi:MAG: acyl-CoA dehydrogenase family protein [Gemmatimonadota bacterium]